jgi:hypothetical protein
VLWQVQGWVSLNNYSNLVLAVELLVGYSVSHHCWVFVAVMQNHHWVFVDVMMKLVAGEC